MTTNKREREKRGKKMKGKMEEEVAEVEELEGENRRKGGVTPSAPISIITLYYLIMFNHLLR